MGFTPLQSTAAQATRSGFTPIEQIDAEGIRQEQPGGSFSPALETVKDIGRVYPVLETAANLATQTVALPVAGIAGLGTLATNALGVTETEPADVVHSVAGAMTYQPVTKSGQHLTGAVMYPFEKLQQAGQHVGGKTLDATGSPMMATAVDTAVQSSPMLLGVKGKGRDAVRGEVRTETPAIEPGARTGFTPVDKTMAQTRQEVSQGVSEHLPASTHAEAAAIDSIPVGFSPIKSARQISIERMEAQLQALQLEATNRVVQAVMKYRQAKRGAKNGGVDQGIQGGMGRMEAHEGAVLESKGQELPQLWREGDQGLPGVAEQLPDIPGRRGAETEQLAVDLAGPDRHQWELRAGEREMGEASAADQRAAVLSSDYPGRTAGDRDGNGAAYRPAEGDILETGNQARHSAGDSGARPASTTEGFTPVDAQRAGLERAAVGEAAGDFQRDAVRPSESRDAAGQGANAGQLAEVPRVGGKLVTEYSNEALGRLSQSRLLSDEAKAKIDVEIVRREEVASVINDKAGEVNVNEGKVSAQVSTDSAVIGRDVTAGVTGRPLGNRDAVTTEVNSSSKPLTSADTMPETAVDSWAPGANYAGFVDRAETGGKLVDKPMRREDVLIPLQKALGVRIYEGRVKGKHRLGTFMPKLEAVRIKRKGDLEIAAHEIAHLLDDRVPEIRKSWTQGPMSKAYADELRSVSYDSKKAYEGFAEFVRLHMTQPEKAKAAAPQFSKWFDDFTTRHEYGPAIKKTQADMGAWFSQDALHRAQSKIGVGKEINKALDGIGDQFRQSVLDDLHGVYRMEREITGKTSPVGPYETARLTRGAYAMTDGAIRLGHPARKADNSFTFEGKGLEKILEPVTEHLDAFLMYAVGKSAQELMAQRREHLFTPAEVSSMVALERPEFRKAFADYQEFNKGVLDFAESMGVINPQSRAMWSRAQYLPFYRVGQAGANKSAGGVSGNWQGVHKLTGGSGNLRDILGNMTQNASMLISASLRNEARAKIADLAEQPGGGRFMVKIAGDAKPVRIDREQVSKAVLEAMGLDRATIKGNPEAAKLAEHAKLIEQQIMASPGMFEFFQHNQAPRGDVMAVLKGGKPTYYEVADPILMRAITSLERPAQHWLVNLLGKPKRIGQATITLTPDFMIANIARDTIMGSVMSRGGFIPVVDSLKGMTSRIKQDPAYQEYIANGGGMSSYLLDETNMRAHLERFYTSKGINPKTVLDAPDKLMYAIETIADSFEMSTRLGEYKHLREQGAHPRHAAYAARDISTDFAMKGDSQAVGMMFDTIMFLRPAVVSMDRLYRGLAHDPNKGAIAAKSAAIAGMSAALYLLNRDNPKYQDLENWDKDNYWHFFVPRPDGSEVHLRFPSVWEVGALAKIAERTMEHTIDQDVLGFGKDAGRILAHLFNLNLMPQVIAPLAEQAANRNSFTNRPIETQGMEDMQPFMRAKPTTSEILKAAGIATRDLPESLQVNPVRAEALIRGYFNTWGMYGLMLSDQAFFGDKLPEKRLDEMPVLRRFYEGEPAKHTRFETEFYDMLGEAKRLHNTMKALDKMNRPDIATEIDRRPMTGMDKQLERANKELRGINGDMLEARRSDMTPAEKRQRLDALTVEKNKLLKAAVLDVKEQQREATR